MVLTYVWENIDRLAFFENAILLELICRAQGTSTKMNVPNSLAAPTPEAQELYPYQIRDLLDDIALVASGTGGPYNVSAACLEVCDCKSRTFVLRLARNNGMNNDVLEKMNAMLSEAALACKNGWSHLS